MYQQKVYETFLDILTFFFFLTQNPEILVEEWDKTSLETIQNLYESNPPRIEAVLKSDGGPTPY